jgi:hypothetical protein
MLSLSSLAGSFRAGQGSHCRATFSLRPPYALGGKLRNEVETPNFGNQIVVRNLLSSLFVYFMRDWADAASPAAKDWFSAVRLTHTARAVDQPRIGLAEPDVGDSLCRAPLLGELEGFRVEIDSHD